MTREQQIVLDALRCELANHRSDLETEQDSTNAMALQHHIGCYLDAIEDLTNYYNLKNSVKQLLL